MMDFEQQEKLGSMIRGALLNSSDGEALNGLRATARTLKSLGVDPHNLAIYDKSEGVSASAAASAIREKRALSTAVGVLIEARARRIKTIQALKEGAGVTLGAAGVTISAGAKSVGQTKNWMKEQIKSAGKSGLTRAALRALDPSNQGITRRIPELLQEGSIFEVLGVLVHVDFSKDYPQEYAAFEAGRQERIRG